MSKLIFMLGAALLSVALSKPHNKEILQRINTINKAQKTWKAGYTPLAEMSNNEMKNILGALKPQVNIRRKQITGSPVLPSEFDARDNWPDCPSISSVKDQGACASSWAVATASAASDRLCIATGYQYKTNLSAENLMACCSYCATNGGCNQGSTISAWYYIQYTGIITGGDYGSKEGCQPYEIYPNGSSTSSLENEYIFTPSCQYDCTNNDYYNSYINDFFYGTDSYFVENDVTEIQMDIFSNGPNVAILDVYDNMQYYRTGVYQQTEGEFIGTQAVRMLGWGTEHDVEYWLLANSWNTSWGENGLLKIRRGKNECGIESAVSGGLMSL